MHLTIAIALSRYRLAYGLNPQVLFATPPTPGCMLRRVQRCLWTRAPCRSRTNLDPFRYIPQPLAVAFTPAYFPNRKFFNFPSLPQLPFASVPRVVSFNDMRVVPYPNSVVLQTVCDVNRYKVGFPSQNVYNICFLMTEQEFLPWVEDSRVISLQPRCARRRCQRAHGNNSEQIKRRHHRSNLETV